MPEETEHPEQLSDDAPLDQVRAWGNREAERRRAAEERASEADDLRRQLAFARAGVDDSTPLGQLFVTGYQGELDVDAVKAAWSAVAPQPETPPANDAGGQPPSQEPGLTPEQQQSLADARQGLNTDTAPPGSEPSTPVGRAMMDAAFEAQGGARARPNTGMGPKAMNAGFSELFRQANEDDSEAVFKRPTEDWADATQRWREANS